MKGWMENMKHMRRGIALVLALLLALGAMGAFAAEANAVKTVKINKTNFPDAKFRSFVKSNFDTNKDGKLSAKEIKAVKEINVKEKGIANLKGVELFVNLENLDCSYNKLTKLDLSKNKNLDYLYCGNNRLKTLNVSKITGIRGVSCEYNGMTKLTLGTHKDLFILGVHGNKMKSLDIKGNKRLIAMVQDKYLVQTSGIRMWYSTEGDIGLVAIDPTMKLMNGKKVLYKP